MQETQAPKTITKRKRAREIAPSSVTLPVKLAAQVYGLSYKALRAAAFRGDLAIIKINRSWYVRRTEVERFIEAHTERLHSAQA